ncbi:class I SAM-dependent methyltransferase, partial [Candidatus Methanocrinis natronophilus]
MLEWTGERYLPFIDPKITGADIHYEHLHRYAFAAQLVEGKDVLDLASGEGYGSYILAKKANHVIGIEIDGDAIAHARNKYLKYNLEFKQGSILEIPVEGTGIFDLIVCFEAVEHVENHKEFLTEVKRLLKEDGILIISTPNKKVYSDDSEYKNPFHVKELYIDEFMDLLSNYFSNIYLLGQRVYTGSNIWPILPKGDSHFSDFTMGFNDGEAVLRDNYDKIPLYLIAIASDSALSKSCLDRSFFIDPNNTLIGLRDSRITELGEEIRRVVERSESLDHAVSERDGRIAELAEEIRGAVERAESLDHAVSERDG